MCVRSFHITMSNKTTSTWEADERAAMLTPPTDRRDSVKAKDDMFDEMKDIARVVREIASNDNINHPVKKCYQPWMMPYVLEYRQERQPYDEEEACRAVSPCSDECYEEEEEEEDVPPDEEDVGEDPSVGTRFAYS